MDIVVTTFVALAASAAAVLATFARLRQLDRRDADPVGPVRLTTAERCVLVDLERDLRVAGRQERRTRPPSGPFLDPGRADSR